MHKFLTASALLALAACSSPPETMLGMVKVPPNLAATKVPILLEGDQILVEIEADRKDGSVRKFLINLNTGGPYSSWQKHVFDEIGFVSGDPVKFRLGGIPIEVAPRHTGSADDVDFPDRQLWPFFFTHKVEGFLECGVLQNFDIAVDYAGKTLTLAAPGTLPHDGTAVPVRVNEKTGLSSVEVTVDGKPYPMVIDFGSPYTWVRPSLAAQWLKSHPDWERARGAVGASNYNMLDYGVEKEGTVIRFPKVTLGPMEVANVGVLGTGAGWHSVISTEGFFDDWQKNAPEPVVAWLGANVLKHYRLTIDYKDRMSYWQKQSDIDPHELDQVGINLVYDKGAFTVGTIVKVGGKPAAQGLESGDRLVAVDGEPVEGWSRDQLFAALGGAPGDLRRLTVERGGKQITVEEKVNAF